MKQAKPGPSSDVRISPGILWNLIDYASKHQPETPSELVVHTLTLQEARASLYDIGSRQE